MKAIIFVALLAAAIGFGYLKFHELTRPLPVPKFDVNKYWGRGDGSNYVEDKTIKPFTVKVDRKEINELRETLNRTLKLTEPLEGVTYQYGFNTLALEQFATYWRDKYLTKWSQREEVLNQFPQYTTEIQGLRIHYIHAKPTPEAAEGKTVLPVLLLHGWPGSVREFYTFIPLLTEPTEINSYVFEVIAPSLVGYGWSEATTKKGFNAAEMAIVMRNLMLRLGHEKFLIQGGDWGSIIGGIVATLFPENVSGYHSNFCQVNTPLSMMKWAYAAFFPERVIPSRFFQNHHLPIGEKLEFLIRESGYFHLQATKPDTIGAALTQSPLGLAAYILEKFQVATGPGLNEKHNAMAQTYTLEAVLDNLMIYYLSNTATSAARFYAENMSKEFLALQLDRVPSPVKMGCARFINDLTPAMDWQLQDKYPNLIHSKYFQQGGHFAALELPVMLYLDFVEFVAKLDGAEA